MPKTCAACGSPASGKFCSQCGAPLGRPVQCAACGNTVPLGGRFCNMCGRPVASGGRGATAPAATVSPATGGGKSWVGAAIAVAVVALLFLLLMPRFRSDPQPTQPPVAASGNPAAIDISSMSPEERAGRLFNRVMESISANDSASARSFTPMAIAAYQMIENLDLDALYHLAVLHLVNNDPASARQTAERILQQVPTHLFGLYTAAQAEQMMGNRERARSLYAEFLERYESELATGRVEYAEHSNALPPMREDAQRVLARQ